ncbi:MAG: hypothetical protein QF415_11040 [Candidatus Undinarchaeales archaeon]|jgi:hypothetical protein|nr:hypothetical protein [Candidatus Undinarchaeales archaeon]MDP7491477.1 hypothetical protein [Candidatus Undinarchaeales archaeon]
MKGYMLIGLMALLAVPVASADSAQQCNIDMGLFSLGAELLGADPLIN